ncbi:ATP-binding cassette domain-containing protein [Loigolactobacillus binensis]|uniref:ATP-binding cassette domain-containing protein n=1 Tax=Loigolactobacillus binensis TaxID=2559922 RepID=A0ABW3EEH0_9LACO|nr:ATP-binding cassette domain-containing protein [Loigolactobacillus binensis]
MTTIQVCELTKSFKGTTVLNQLNFTLTNGVVGLLGRNGAGKTTLMKIIATLLRQSSGLVMIDQAPVTNVRQVRQMIGYLPQNFQIYRNMRVVDALTYLGLLSELEPATLAQRIDRLLIRLNLGKYRQYKIKELSGGLKQRVGIAQALLNEPKILIIDEPTVGLDPEERDNFRRLIGELGDQRIVIFSTHIVEDIARISDQLVILEGGTVAFAGPTATFAADPDELETKYLALIRGGSDEGF